MKNLFLTSLILISSILSVNAQTFEGEISYKITYTDLPPEMEMMQAMLPAKTVVLMKNEKSASEQNTMGMVNIKTISNTETKITSVLIDMMGKKIYTESELDANKSENNLEVIKESETKSIAGYKCKKAIIKMEDGIEMEYWYTTELPAYQGSNVPNIDIEGFPMEFGITQQGMTMKMIVDSVVKKSVSDSEFEIPADYEKKTQKEMQDMFKGMMGGM